MMFSPQRSDLYLTREVDGPSSLNMNVLHRTVASDHHPLFVLTSVKIIWRNDGYLSV
jgi:hypothetical protein